MEALSVESSLVRIKYTKELLSWIAAFWNHFQTLFNFQIISVFKVQWSKKKVSPLYTSKVKLKICECTFPSPLVQSDLTPKWSLLTLILHFILSQKRFFFPFSNLHKLWFFCGARVIGVRFEHYFISHGMHTRFTLSRLIYFEKTQMSSPI